MTVKTIYESDSYSYEVESRYGISWYTRKSDDHVTLLNTGSDAVEEIDKWERWAGNPYYSKKHKDAIFDGVAVEHSFEPRWGE